MCIPSASSIGVEACSVFPMADRTILSPGKAKSSCSTHFKTQSSLKLDTKSNASGLLVTARVFVGFVDDFSKESPLHLLGKSVFKHK